MKMIFRPNIKIKNHRNKFRKKKFLAAALAVFFLLVIIFKEFSFDIINRPLFYILKPFLEARRDMKDWWQKTKSGFNEKKNLWDENKVLNEKVMEMGVKIALLEIIEKENIALKAAFSAEERQNFIFGSIILRPPQMPYDMLIIDAGKKNGAKEGMPVSAFGKVLLGYVVDVFKEESKVKLISSFGEETNALLEFSGTPVIAIGKGGENFEILLPKTVSISVGEKIITMGKNPMLIGIVEKIEHQTADPYQKIFFRLPINIQYLNQVFLLKK